MLEWNKAFRTDVEQFLDYALLFYASSQRALSVKLIEQLSSLLSSQSPNCVEYPFEQLQGGVLLSNKKLVKKRIFHILKQHSKCESERLSLSGFAKGMLLRLVWHLDNAIRAKDKKELLEKGFEEYRRILIEEYDEKKSMSYLNGLYFSRSPCIEDEEAFGDVGRGKAWRSAGGYNYSNVRII
ncbi:uncharacterized protein MONOS_3127 [Monocercomonoides exilis]|uniref:uncharacterized protein n=1 Tax=Monocercomonoides exilis TaxID=2049356 RepID=UPI00355A4504|nr:hypothetical protein MONOS_3127 [Monocercomonoides exilis]|eukprot:MONOS_3127.1-p1 / transcript=MONOS_3127.1 / gene=MONOS_3127 / organism=Monocercomonoides_exilis_PA203 / gene_product=unspecified product / transcript_product=unspecified product / location=Mono_scaffold00070:144107-145204(+) / protein_length=183 / sequence_SO=supercontig / SO=protein_coding / is_pseudo=false